MSWDGGYDNNWNCDIGYGVPSICDHPGCNEKIDRGLSFVRGGDPYGGKHRCGLYFCRDHLTHAGDRRDNAQLCKCCYASKGRTYNPTPDTPEWIEHKATHSSWAEWRQQQEATR